MEWLATIECPDKTCRRLLALYASHADAAWGGKMGVDETADRLAVSVATVVRHRAHLAEQNLIRFGGTPVHLPSGRYTRDVSTYLLCTGLLGPRGENYEEDTAWDVLVRVEWWTSTDKALRERAMRAILACLRMGWSVAELAGFLDIVPGAPVTSPLGLLRKLLPTEPPAVPAAVAHGGVAAGPVHCAAGCGRQFPVAEHAAPGTVCRACREERAEEHERALAAAAAQGLYSVAVTYNNPF
ncbi:hypothetical protein [Streptomyces sp. NPDC001205]